MDSSALLINTKILNFLFWCQIEKASFEPQCLFVFLILYWTCKIYFVFWKAETFHLKKQTPEFEK